MLPDHGLVKGIVGIGAGFCLGRLAAATTRRAPRRCGAIETYRRRAISMSATSVLITPSENQKGEK